MATRQSRIGRARAACIMVALALSTAPAAVVAQSGPPPGMPPGGPPGGAGPGRPPRPPKPLKRDAVIDAARAQHRAADVDGNGYLTLAEVRGSVRALADAAVRRRFAAIDADRSGTIDLAEFAAWQETMGGRVLSDQAAADLRREMVPETLAFDPGGGEYAPVLRMLIAPVGATSVVQADANADGRVDAAEWQQFQLRGFDRLDANSDGLLDLMELPRPGPGDAPGERPGMPPPDGMAPPPRPQ